MANKKRKRPMSQRQYRQEGGNICPSCGGTDISGTEITIEGALAFQEMDCADCDTTWNDVYKLDGYSCLEEGQGNG